jgi:hypothetical protein
MKMHLFAATLAGMAALPAQAAVTLYTNEAAYLAAVGATRTYIDFAGSPGAVVSGGSFSADVTFGSCTDSSLPGTCGTNVLHSSDAITDVGGSAAPNGVASLAWRFNLSDVQAFGFRYISGAIDSVALVASDLSIDVIDTVAASGFIGLVSDTNFYGGIGVNAVFAGGIGNDRYFIDDFRINRAGAVPEPATWALTGLALLAAAGLGRRPSRVLSRRV